MRGKKAQIRAVKPDHVYQSEAVARLIGYVMKDGKKSVAQKEVYEAFSQVDPRKPAVLFVHTHPPPLSKWQFVFLLK